MGDGEPEVTHAMVMPFVVVQSRGGPYDDEAFAAGWACGQIDTKLQIIATVGGQLKFVPVRPATVAQLDLVAMRHGYRLLTEPSGVDGWVMATFTRAEEQVPGE